jgi:hypothetical protein
LLELVVAMTIFAVVMMGIAATIGTGLALTRTNRHRSVAANLAAQEMDAVRSMDFIDVAAATSTFDVDGVAYTIHREVTWVAKSATSGPCDGSGSPQVLRVRVSVEWPNMRGVKPVVSDTTLTPPVGAYDPNTGHIGVKVLDRNAEPQFLVPVTVAGPTSDAAPTNSDGCAFFGFLPAGTYTATLGSTGWVDRQGNASPSQTLGVTVGNISSVQFDYDEAASLDVTMSSPNAYPIPNDLPVTVANPQLVPNGVQAKAGTGAVRNVANLFPFLDGYQYWAGSCADADPEGVQKGTDAGGHPIVIGAYWPGATRAPNVAVEGGAASPAAVTLGDVDVYVTSGTGTPRVGYTVTATHATDDICGTQEVHTLGVTDGAGHVAAALPYGTWQFRTPGHSAVGSFPNGTISPLAPAPVAVTVKAN